jgi:hypothetical protein
MKRSFTAGLIGCLATMQSFTFAHTQTPNFVASPSNAPATMTTAEGTTPYVDQSGYQVRAKVITVFEKLFNNPSEVKWNLSNNRYLASFNYNGQPCIALFNIGGAWIYTMKYCTEKELPRDAYRLLKGAYIDYKIGVVTDVTTPQGQAWIANLEDKDNLVVAKVVDGNLEELHSYKTH